MATPISDREVGGLDALPLPPHHGSGGQVFRSDSDVSASSTASSVPRSSSFTRSKRFLTGDGLSAREALGIIDTQDAGTTEEGGSAGRLVHSFDVARSAMRGVFQEPSNITPPPPPKVQLSVDDDKRRSSAAPPPAPPLPKRLSGIVWDDDLDEDDEKENEESVASSALPQSPESLASLSPKGMVNVADASSPMNTPVATPDKAKRRVRSPLAGVANRKRKAVKNALTPTTTPNADRETGAPDLGASPFASPFASPAPRSTTMAKLRGLFSPRASPTPAATEKGPAVPPIQLTANAAETKPAALHNGHDRGDSSVPIPATVKVAGPVPNSQAVSSATQKSEGTNRKLLEKQSSSKHPDSPERDPGISFSCDSDVADAVVNEKPVLSGEHSVLSKVESAKGDIESTTVASKNVGRDALKSSTPVPMTSNREQLHPNAFHIPAPAALRERVQNVSAESAAALKKESVKKRTDLFKRFKMIQEKAKFDVNAPGPKTTAQPRASQAENEEPAKAPLVPAEDKPVPSESNRTEDYSAAKLSQPAAPVPSDDNVSFMSAPEDFSPEKNARATEKSIVAAKSEQDNASEGGSSPGQASQTSPTVESMTTSSSSQSRGDRYCTHPGAFDANTDVYNMNSTAPVQAQGTVLGDTTSHPLNHFGMPVSRTAPITGVNAHGFMDGPVFEAVIEDAGRLRHTRRDSHAAYVQAYPETVPKEPVLSLPEANNGQITRANNSEAPSATTVEKTGEVQMRKTKSGLQKRLTKAKDAGAGMVARAKKIPRGASFPRLRAWGDNNAAENESSDRTKSQARHSDAKPVKAKNESPAIKPAAQPPVDVSKEGKTFGEATVESNKGTEPAASTSDEASVKKPEAVTVEQATASRTGSSDTQETAVTSKSSTTAAKTQPTAKKVVSEEKTAVTGAKKTQAVPKEALSVSKAARPPENVVSDSKKAQLNVKKAVSEEGLKTKSAGKTVLEDVKKIQPTAKVLSDEKAKTTVKVVSKDTQNVQPAARKLVSDLKKPQAKVMNVVVAEKTSTPNKATKVNPIEKPKVHAKAQPVAPTEKSKMRAKATKAVPTENTKAAVKAKKIVSEDKVKAAVKEKQEVSGTKSRDKPAYVTIQRVIRRVKRDGTEEVISKKIRLKPEQVLPNGDVVVRRTMKRMKDDGSGHETLTVMQVIPRKRKKSTPAAQPDEVDLVSNGPSSMPDLKLGSKKEAAKPRQVADEAEAVFDNRPARLSERSTSLPSGSLEGRRGSTARNGTDGDKSVPTEHGPSATVHLPRANTVGNLRSGGKAFEDVKAAKPVAKKRESPFRRTKSVKIGRSKSGISSRESKVQEENGGKSTKSGLWTLGRVPRVISFHGRERKEKEKEEARKEGGKPAGFGAGLWRRE